MIVEIPRNSANKYEYDSALGVFRMDRDPRYDQIHTVDQVFAQIRREIEHFFTMYKELEDKKDAHPGLARSQGGLGNC